MGMYDDITCNARLPGTPPGFIGPGHRFQSKSLDCSMSAYEITADGRLLATLGPFRDDQGQPEPVPHHGVVDFYASNLGAGWHGFLFTKDGEDAESVEYRATFDRGVLAGIMETARTREPALPVSAMDDRPAARDADEAPEQPPDPVVGRTLFLREGWGESEHFVPVEVVVVGPFEWVGRTPDGHLKAHDRRFSFGSRLFETPQQGVKARVDADRGQRERREHFQRLLDAKQGEPS